MAKGTKPVQTTSMDVNGTTTTTVDQEAPAEVKPQEVVTETQAAVSEATENTTAAPVVETIEEEKKKK